MESNLFRSSRNGIKSKIPSKLLIPNSFKIIALHLAAVNLAHLSIACAHISLRVWAQMIPAQIALSYFLEYLDLGAHRICIEMSACLIGASGDQNVDNFLGHATNSLDTLPIGNKDEKPPKFCPLPVTFKKYRSQSNDEQYFLFDSENEKANFRSKPVVCKLILFRNLFGTNPLEPINNKTLTLINEMKTLKAVGAENVLTNIGKKILAINQPPLARGSLNEVVNRWIPWFRRFWINYRRMQFVTKPSNERIVMKK
ncbi:hypothetical protein ACJJTC_007469 [Scirpophaga incertulas]